MEGFTGGFLLLCLFSLVKANSSPTLNNNLYKVCEDVPIGGHAFDIEASDSDNDPLTYTLTGDNAAFFTVDKNTGSVTVRNKLDREAGDVMKIEGTISDGFNVISIELTIVLEDANDNKPIFQQSSYNVEVPENQAIGSTLFRVEAIDYDTSLAGVVRYSIDEVSPNNIENPFTIISTTGQVSLVKGLNYTSLSSFYRLKINATDGGGNCASEEVVYNSAIVFSFITVQDVPDMDPQFTGTSFVGSVKENSPVGTSVFQVTAIDPDTGILDKMIYSIEASTIDGLFTISSDEGIISVLSMIDREVVGDTVTLTVKATESKVNIHGVHASATTDVQINILDVNDNKPEFYKCNETCVIATEFSGDIDEHSIGAVPINMKVIDLDKTANTELRLEGVDKDVFSVEPSFTQISNSVVQLLVRQSQNLDFEKKQQMILQVIAIDKEINMGSTATVTINIKDINDNSPTFPNTTYKLSVAEHSPVNTVVDTITADDPDTMDQGKITYLLLPESILTYFDVNPNTGEIYVKNQDLLDREARSLHSGTLQARDTNGNPGSTVLEITLTDINDQPPVINRDSYLQYVLEGANFELLIEATDRDEPNTPNSEIVFSLEPNDFSGNFTINPSTGIITNNGELDREAIDPKLDGRIELTVKATDKGSPALSSTAPVVVNVEDVNDNAPQFKDSSYTFSIKEGIKGFVGSVHAEDLDQTTGFNRISFSIISGSLGSFVISTSKGEKGYIGRITVDPELDYESSNIQYKLQVEAVDLGNEKAEITVEVNVLDVNDERPEFESIEPVLVKENTTITEAIGKFIAHDKDTNHLLVYELESVTCMCGSSSKPCSWFVLDSNGDVRVNPEQTVDFEECNQAVMQAQVVDVNTETGQNNSIIPGRMIINIEDINDNAPQFSPPDSVFVVVSEGASVGTSVAKVTATDLDSGVHSQMKFEVKNVKFKDTNDQTTDKLNLFDAVTTQQNNIYVGLIQTIQSLDLNLRGKYLVTITATDTGGLSSSTVVEIFTVDITYKIELQFDISEDEVKNKEDDIKRTLTSATQSVVKIISIEEVKSKATSDKAKTLVVAYFVYLNGTALTRSEVEAKLSDPEYFLVLQELGLSDIGTAPETEKGPDPVQYGLLGLVAGLIIVLVVLTTSLLCTRRSYRRKLKAAKAMNSASAVNADNQKSGPVVPGTNKYTMEGANPVLNLNIDTSLALNMDEENSDVDKVSLNSLDYSDDVINEKGTKSSMQSIQEEEENGGPPEYSEPLGAALAQLGQKKNNNMSPVGFTNPVFDTTDL